MKLGNIQLKKGGGGGGGGQPQTPWASNINGANFTLSNAVLGTNIKATTISEAVAGGGISFITSQGAFAWGGDNVSMSLADDTETFFMTADGGITFGSIAGFAYNGANTSLAINDTTDNATITASSINLSGNTIVSGYLRVGTTVRTGDPGNGQGEWRLGTAIAGLVGLDTTKHVEVMIDGVLTKLACAS